MSKPRSGISAGSTTDPDEIDRFDALAESWWDPDGPMRPLHRLNPARLSYIREQLSTTTGTDRRNLTPLTGLRVLDVGCGCGLVAEPLARMGAKVTAIDPSQRNIEVARRHAEAQAVTIDYRPIDTEALLCCEVDGTHPRFDAVTCLEVIEHSADPERLVGDLAELLTPGGTLLLSTLNRTAKSFAQAIVAAEYLLGWLPRGTHDWRRFMPPSEVAALMRRHRLLVRDVTGFGLDPETNEFRLSRDRGVNYIMTADKI